VLHLNREEAHPEELFFFIRLIFLSAHRSERGLVLHDSLLREGHLLVFQASEEMRAEVALLVAIQRVGGIAKHGASLLPTVLNARIWFGGYLELGLFLLGWDWEELRLAGLQHRELILFACVEGLPDVEQALSQIILSLAEWVAFFNFHFIVASPTEEEASRFVRIRVNPRSSASSPKKLEEVGLAPRLGQLGDEVGLNTDVESLSCLGL